MSNVKLTFPAKQEGQTHWAMYQTINVPVPQPDTRSLWQKFVYRSLMKVHDWAEDLWHWCYYTAQKYEAPQPKYREKHIKIGDYEA